MFSVTSVSLISTVFFFSFLFCLTSFLLLIYIEQNIKLWFFNFLCSFNIYLIGIAEKPYLWSVDPKTEKQQMCISAHFGKQKFNVCNFNHKNSILRREEAFIVYELINRIIAFKRMRISPCDWKEKKNIWNMKLTSIHQFS